ncbi:serine, glycine, tyrosine and glutamine-rich protein [Capsicum annuum]|uniref:serine, glycine, tyrosine and glutamine-rich protein n=1 Tax=Capsicum annuum TaxID=4072 RepID=UPI0007BEAE5D|nr:serine, glycine, tyrosine and glutamine-rich protein [Capsicum annuum]
MARFLVSSFDGDESFGKSGAMISYYEGLFLLYAIIFAVVVVSIVVFLCTDHPGKDTVSNFCTGGSNFGGTGSMIMYSSGAGAAACGGGGGSGGGGGFACGDDGGGCGGNDLRVLCKCIHVLRKRVKNIMASFLVSSLDVDESFSKSGAMISYSGGLFLLCANIFAVLVMSIVVFSCTHHPENDTLCKKQKKSKRKFTGTGRGGGGNGGGYACGGGGDGDGC